MKLISTCVLICLVAATAADAQGRGGGDGGGRAGGGRGRQPPTSGPPSDPSRPSTPAKSPDQVQIVGVITAIDAASERLTIAYDAVEALNLPAGVRPFAVSRGALMKDAKVGEKVQFTLESQQIASLQPFQVPEP